MRIEINNVCKIRQASIDLNGLTIISGENDTGKSTIGKILFSIINSYKSRDTDLEEILDKILEKVEEIYFYMRRNIKSKENYDEIRSVFFPPYIMSNIERLCRDKNFNEIELFLEKKMCIIDALNSDGLNLSIIQKKIKNIIEIVENIDNEDIRRREKIKKYLLSEFNFEVNNKFLGNYSTVELYDGNNILLDLNIENNNLTKYNVYDILNFKDATYIDTPLVLQMQDLIMYAKQRSRNKKQMIPIHMVDLIEKIESSYLVHEENEFIGYINETINGSFKINEEDKHLSFLRKHINETFVFKPLNTASGIKSFGVLELLMRSGDINQSNILIIDEPEIHLHPEWQIKYGEIICKLVSQGMNILITTHSPYMLQALDYFSDNLKSYDRFRSYIANSDNEITYYEDVTYDINKAFIKLSTPLQKIMWR